MTCTFLQALKDRLMFKDRETKRMLLYITYGVVLFMALLNLDKLWHGFLFFLSILSPIFIGLALAFIFNIPMMFFERHLHWLTDRIKSSKLKEHIRRALGIILTFLAIALFVTFFVIFVIPQLQNSVSIFIERFPGYWAQFNALAAQIPGWVSIPADYIDELLASVQTYAKEIGDMLLGAVPQIVSTTVGITQGFFSFVMGLVFSVYMLASKERLLALKDRMMMAYCPEKLASFLYEVGRTANKIFHGFIAGQMLEAFILGTLCSIGLAILQIPYALLIGVLVGITSIIPIFGAFLGAVPSVFILLMVNPWYALWFLIYLIALQQFESNVIYPKVVGSSVGLSGLWALVGMLLGGRLFGFFGIILGIPTFAVIYGILRTLTNRRLTKRTGNFQEGEIQNGVVIEEDRDDEK